MGKKPISMTLTEMTRNTGYAADITVLHFFKVYCLRKIMTCKRICYGTPE